MIVIFSVCRKNWFAILMSVDPMNCCTWDLGAICMAIPKFYVFVYQSSYVLVFFGQCRVYGPHAVGGYLMPGEF